MAETLLLVALTLAVVGVLVWRFPETARSVYRTIRTFRRVVGGVIALFVALALLSTGNVLLMLAGAALLAYAALWVVFEEPHDIVLRALR